MSVSGKRRRGGSRKAKTMIKEGFEGISRFLDGGGKGKKGK